MNSGFGIRFFFMRLFTAFFFVMICSAGFGQNSVNFSDNNWFFGANQRGLLFGKSDGMVRIDSVQATPFGNNGSLVVTNYFSGDFLFYSDGSNVYDATHRLMPFITTNGPLGGNTSFNQPVAAAPVPDSSNRYYIFTNGSQIVSHIVDMNNQGNFPAGQPPLGDIVGGPTVVFPNSPGEAMLVIPGATLLQNWLLIQDSVTTEYQVYAIGQNSNFNLVSNLTLDQQFAAANFSYSPAARKIAISPKAQNRNVHILDFNPANGNIAFDTVVLNTGNADFSTEAIYDTEWSPDGTKLYISRHGSSALNTAMLYQFDLTDTVQLLNPILQAPIFRSYGLSIAPDSSIYHLYQNASGGPFLIGRIDSVNNPFDSISYDPSPLGGANFQGRQFPQFSPQNFASPFQVDFVFEGNCADTTQNTKFYPIVSPQPESFSWDFGDGNTSNEISPVHTYDGAGTFNVRLRVVRNGIPDSIVKPVSLLDPMTMLDLGNDTTICPGEMLTLTATLNPPMPGASFVWNTGETTESIQANSDTTMTYWVSATLPNGCVLFDEIMVEVFESQVQVANFWYFGDRAGIDFNQQPPIALTDGQMTAPEGTSTISDTNGDLLFYTNGNQVFNKDHMPMLGSPDIGGEVNSTQAALIIQFPMDETFYYIFTTEEIYGTNTFNLNYAVVDIKGDNGLGEIVQKDIQLFSRSTERIAANGTGAGSDTWLVAHEFGNNTFRAYPVTDTGIGNPVLSSVGSIHSIEAQQQGEGYLKFNGMSDKLAVALSGPNSNYVEVFDFNPQTGELTPFLSKIDVGKESADQEVYGLHFSPGGNKLFASFTGSNSKIIEFRIDTNDVDLVEQSIQELPGLRPGDEYGAIQNGPDQQIYVAVNNAAFLGTISADDSVGLVSQYNPDAFNLMGRNSLLGLPNFVQNLLQPPQSPGMTVGNGCLGDSISLTGSGVSNIDQFQWTVMFGGATVFTDTNPMTSFMPSQAGTYDINLQISNRCMFDTLLTQSIEVFIGPNAPGDTVAALCGPTLDLAAAPSANSNLSYLWSTGDTSRVITVSQPGTFTVTVTDQNGCSTPSGIITVADGRPLVDIGPPNQNVCQNQAVPALDAGNSGATFTWTINGNDQNNNTRTQNVNTATPGTFAYIVQVEDPISACVGTDTTVITVGALPNFTFTADSTSGCGLTDGAITLTNAGSMGNFGYLWENGDTTMNRANLAAGNYSVTITDQVSGCTQSINGIPVNDSGSNFTINTPAGSSQCVSGNFSGGVDVTISGGAGLTFTYTLINQADGTALAPVVDDDTVNLNVPQAGTYTLQVVDDSDPACTQFSSVTVSDAPTVNFQLAQSVVDACEGDGSTLLEVANPDVANFEYSWSTNNGSFAGTTTLPQVGVTSTGTYSVTVTDRNGVLCDSTASATVTFNPDIDPDIVSSGDDCDGTLDLTAIDNNRPGGVGLTYSWSTGSVSQSIVIEDTSAVSVTIRDQAAGCSAMAADTFSVRPALEVTVSSTPQCANELPVILTADISNPTNVSIEWTRNGSPLQDNDETIDVEENGTFRSTITQDICVVSDELQVSIDSATSGQLNDMEEFCSLDMINNTVVLNPGSFQSFAWSTGDSTQTITLTGDEFNNANRTILFTVALTNGAGCTSVDSVFVQNNCDPTVTVPNAFYPESGIDANRVFRAFMDERVQNFEIFIYNRWGELIFSSQSLDFEWNGTTNNGEDAPMGTYAYIMKFESTVEPGRMVEQRGGVVLIR